MNKPHENCERFENNKQPEISRISRYRYLIKFTRACYNIDICYEGQ